MDKDIMWYRYQIRSLNYSLTICNNKRISWVTNWHSFWIFSFQVVGKCCIWVKEWIDIMYLENWNLHTPPFNNSPDPRFFYWSRHCKEALSQIIYTIRNRIGCAMLTGDPGVGKTTMSNLIIEKLPKKTRSISNLGPPPKIICRQRSIV